MNYEFSVILILPQRHIQVQSYDYVFFTESVGAESVAPGFKHKIRYTQYMSLESQISHIATNKGNIKRQYLLHNVLVKRKNNLRV